MNRLLPPVSVLAMFAIPSCTDRSITSFDTGEQISSSSHIVNENEEEVYGNIYANGVQDTSSLYYVSLVPADFETASRLVGTFDSLVYQTHGRTFAFGWFDPADTESALCGTLSSYLNPATSDSARGMEVHAESPGIIGGGREGHCIRPGTYRISLWKDGVSGPIRTMEIDYVQIGGSTWDTTPGAPNSTLLVENGVFDPQQTGLADNVVHFDLTAGSFSDTAVLQIDTARVSASTKMFLNDASPSGLHTDWFRYGAQRSTSSWYRAGSAGGNLTLQARLFFDYGRQASLISGYYTTFPSHSGAPVLRVYRYFGRLPGDTSATVQVGLHTKRPDEPTSTTPDVLRPIQVVVGSPPPDTAINTFAMPSGVLESANTWLMTDQYLNASVAEAGPNLSYSWRFDQGNWISAGSLFDLAGFNTSGSHSAVLRVYNSSTDSSHYYVGSIQTTNDLLGLYGPQNVSVKTTHTYTSSVAGIWTERDSFPDNWRLMLWPSTDTYTRIWAGGDYTMDLRVQSASSPLGRARMQVTVCIASQSCSETQALSTQTAQAGGGDVLFGAGPIMSWGDASRASAVRYYDLTGNHKTASLFAGSWWLNGQNGSDTGGLGMGVVAWASSQDSVSQARIIDFAVASPGSSYVFGLSLDPDLGTNLADDNSGYDASLGMLYAHDSSTAVGVLLLSGGKDALATATQYGARRSPPVSDNDLWLVQRRRGMNLMGGENDVQFIASAFEAVGNQSYRLIIVHADDLGKLRSAARSILRRQ